MVYMSYERPMVSATLVYYDGRYRRETAERVLRVLEENRLFHPASMDAGKLTRGKIQLDQPSMRNTLMDAYAEKDVGGVYWETADPGTAAEYLTFQWSFTFHKRSRLPVEPRFQPWNILTLQATYGWLREEDNYAAYMRTVRSLIPVVDAFCAKIDDLGQAAARMNKTRERHFTPEHIQQVYWGNYWGKHLKGQADVSYLRSLPLFQFQETEDGVFFTLSESVFDCNSWGCRRLRKKILTRAVRPPLSFVP